VRIDHLSADEQPVSRLDAHVVDRLRGGRVLEDLLGQLGGLLFCDCHQSIVK